MAHDEGVEATRPHPLGPRDIIDVITVWGRAILTVSAIVLAVAGGFVLGQQSRHLVLLKRPEGATGVAWSCGGRMSLSARFEDLGVDPVRLTVAGALAPTGPLTPDPSGRLIAYLPDMPYSGTASRVVVAALPEDVGVETREISVPVLECEGSVQLTQ